MKKTLTITSMFLMLITSIPVHSLSETTNWKLVKNEDGIKVYIARSLHSDIIKAKSSIDINFSISKVQSVLDNIEKRQEWIPYLKKSSILKHESENESLEYSLFSAPWPASDRDFVYRLKMISNTKNKRVYQMQSDVSDLKPKNDGVVRAVLFESIYTLTAIDENTTRVNLTFHADFGGWLPDWISNMVQKALPYKTLRNLKYELIKLENKTVKFKIDQVYKCGFKSHMA